MDKKDEMKKLKANFKDSGYILPLSIVFAGIGVAAIAAILIQNSFPRLVGILIGCLISSAGTEFFRTIVSNRKHR